MNIFETIERATSRIERFHSQFLADSLQESLAGYRSLFDQVWTLVAPPDWEIPESADQVRVIPEQAVEGGRIDICIESLSPQPRIVGIEIKTVEESNEPGQLERYLNGLSSKFPGHDIQIAYLTPFNRNLAGVGADSLPTVLEFERFRELHPRARQVSWLDLESIPWDGNPLWRQHQAYVRDHISSQDKLRASIEKARDIGFFFGAGPARSFWDELSAWEVGCDRNCAVLDLAKQRGGRPVVDSMVRAFESLINSDNVIDRERNDKFADNLRQRFLNSQYGEIHAALFDLAQRFDHVWVEGKQDYGVRVAHKDFPSGVSLVTSNGPGRLLILVNR